LPPRRKVKISVCHIWLGVERSKKRGWGGLRWGLRLGFLSNCCSCNVRRTVSRLTGRNNTRRRNWLIFLIPISGWRRLSSTTFVFTAAATFGRGRLGPADLDFKPASPWSRYSLTHLDKVLRPTPISRATRSTGKLSSRHNCTALRRTANEWE